MKLEDFAYAVARKVFDELEHHHHFVVPPEIRKTVIAKVKEDLNELVK